MDNTDEKKLIEDTFSIIKKKYIVLSGKGGVGKSSVAVNIAVGLALQGKKVGLLDTDLHGPSVPKMLNIVSHKMTGTESSLDPAELYDGNLKIMSVQFLISNPTDSIIWRGPLKHKTITQFLTMTQWGELDYLIIDSPPGTGDEPLSVIQTIPDCDGAIVVTTPQMVSTFDVKKSLDFCQKLNLPIKGVIENMAGFVCTHCDEITYIFGKNGGKTMADEYGVPFLGSIPLDPSIVTLGDIGKPFIETLKTGSVIEIFNSILKQL